RRCRRATSSRWTASWSSSSTRRPSDGSAPNPTLPRRGRAKARRRANACFLTGSTLRDILVTQRATNSTSRQGKQHVDRVDPSAANRARPSGRAPEPPSGCPVDGAEPGQSGRLEPGLPHARLAGCGRFLRVAGEGMRRCYGRRYPYRHANYHLREWQRRRRVTLQRNLIVALIVLFGLPLLTVPALAAQTVGDVPSVTGLASTGLPQDMLIFDRHGNLLADVGDQGDHRIVVPISYISPNIINATIAIEDHTFYSNSGVDPTAILRAALADYSHHGIKQGGSTISQQLVKQLFIGPNPDNSIQRKAKEAVLALIVN